MYNRILNIVFLFFFIILSGCSLSPETRKMPLTFDIPTQWVGADSASAVSIDHWWETFADPSLDTLIAQVMKNNYNLKATTARLDAAIAQAQIAGADLFPQLNGAASASRSKQNFVGFPMGGASDEVLTSLQNSFTTSLNLSWEIDLWGRIRAGKSAAVADFEATRAEVAGAYLSFTAQTAKIWYGAVEAQQQVELARATAESYRKNHEQILSRYERGLRTSLDVRLSESNLASAEATLFARENMLARFQRQLEALSGQYPSGTYFVETTLPDALPPVPSGIPADLITRRPDLVSAERRLAAADSRASQAVRALFPRLSISSAYGTKTDTAENLTNSDYSVWNLVGNLLQPLFQGGRLKAGVHLAKSQADQARANYAQSIINAFSEVENALQTEQFLASQERAMTVAAQQAIAAEKLAEERYLSGLQDFITVLESQRRAFTAQSQLLAIQRQRLETRIDFYLALGGGFDSTNSTYQP